ncbi:MAG: complex I subunit 5 family protein [Candidatus Acetothermia bacterium]
MVNPALLLAGPLALAFLVPVVRYVSQGAVKWIPVFALSFNFIGSVLLIPSTLDEAVVTEIGGFSVPLCINLVAGPLGTILSSFIALIGLLVAIYSFGYIKEGPTARYYTLFLLLLVGATGIVLTGDVFNLFVFFEILCISSYSLVAYLGDKSGVEASFKYLVQGSVGSSLLLLGIGLLYGQYGTLNMGDLAGRIGGVGSPSVFVPMMLMVTGLGVEAAIFPLNAWLPDAHSSAPSSISAVLSGIAISVGLYAVARVIFTVFGGAVILQALAVIGLMTLLIGELSAFSQDDIKRLLAYSSIGQMGLIALGFGIATGEGVSGGLFQLISHGLSKALLFLSVGYMIYRVGSKRISSLRGSWKRTPVAALGFAVGAFSLIGLPPFIGFPGKFLIVRAALLRGDLFYTVLVAFLLFATLVEAGYFLKIVQVIFFTEREGSSPGKEIVPVSGLIPIVVLMILILLVGVYPGLITGFVDSAAAELTARADYFTVVMGVS